MLLSSAKGAAFAPKDAARAALIAACALVGCSLLALLVALTAGSCAAWPDIPLPSPCHSRLAVPLAIVLAMLPLLALVALRRPFIAILGLYIVLVPIDATLLPGSHTSLTKLVGILVAVAAIWTIAQRRDRVRVPYAVFGWLAVVCVMALSTIWAIDPAASFHELSTIASAFALFAVVVVVPINREDFRAIIVATITSGAVAGILAIAEQHMIQTAISAPGRLQLTVGTATTIDPNQLAAALLLPVAITVAVIARSRGWRLLPLVVALILMLAAIYFTASRGAVFALLAMAIAGILATRRRALLSGLLGVALGLIFIIPNVISSRLLEARTGTGSGRLDIWHVALGVFKNHWLLGTGFANFPAAYDRAFFSAYESQFENWHRASHSLIVSTSTELGVVGIVVMATAWFLQYRSLRSIGPAHPYAWTRAAFSAALVGLLVAAFFLDLLTFKYSWLLFMEMLLSVRLGQELGGKSLA